MNDIREDLKAYLDGELETARAQEVEQALAADPALRQEAELMKAMSETLKAMVPDTPPTGAAKTLDRLRSRRRWSLGQWVTMGGAIALAFVAINLVRPGGGAMESADLAVYKEMSPGNASSAPASTLPSTGDETIDVPTLRGGGVGGGGGADKAPGRSSSPAPIVDVPSLNPLLIRTANLWLKVNSASESLAQAEQIAKGNGGFTTSTNHSSTEGATPSATATLRVPVKTFESALGALRKLGEVVQDQSNSDDVTTEVADSEARIKVMRAEEDSYVTMLRAARRVGELLEIKERLSSVRQQIESLDAQRKALRGQASYSTINVTFTERPKAGEPKKENWSGDAWSNAVNGLMSVLRSLGQAAIFAFVYAPIWLPILFVGWLVARRLK
ncbi:MAG: DUF4349 domain-containing protein [Methanoregulaceae archaeon]|nr:DUF4349 domain-containing protein [Methanoregulaceae archaeon]